jgi:O-antigen biosynthesis protein
LSFLTPIWNTDPIFINVLAESLLPQLERAHAEWVLLDNGSDRKETLERLDRLRKHPNVRFARSGRNLGIIGGLRHCLERASGRYVATIDHDDYLHPGAVGTIADFLEQSGYPALTYTDEDKLDGERLFQPYFKPGWDPVLFVNSCYIAHLGAFDRTIGLQLGVYTDAATEGSHDWDTFMRFYLAGHTPVHLPEVTYSWRLHPDSTSANIDSKSYIHSSHQAVLTKFLEARGQADSFDLVLSPLFGGTPDRWFRRKRVMPRPMSRVIFASTPAARSTPDSPKDYPITSTVTVAREPIPHLRQAAESALAAGALMHLVWDRSRPLGDEWPWEALGLMELFPDTVMVGGRSYGSDGRIRAAGYYFGFGAGCGCPDKGRPVGDPGYFAQMWKPHTVSAVSSQHAVVEPAFLLQALDQFRDIELSYAYLGAWIGAHAKRTGRRVIYTPFLEALCDDDWDTQVDAAEIRSFLRACSDIVPDIQLLSPRLGLTAQSAYIPVSDDERDGHLDKLGVSPGGVVHCASR